MPSSLVDLVKISVNSTGTGAITLGTAVEGYRGREVLTNGTVYSYSIQQGSAWEFGRGTYLSEGQQIVRSVIDSSDGGTPIGLKVGATIAFTALSDDLMPTTQLTDDVQAKVDAAEAAKAAAEVAEDGAIAAQGVATTQAAASQDAAAAALVTLADVSAEGDVKIAEVNAAADVKIAEVTAAGSAVSSAATLYSDALSTGDLMIAHQTVGAVTQVSLTGNVGVYQIGLLNGTHLTTGDIIKAIQWSWAAATGTVSVEVKIWKRNVAEATTAGTINNAAPIATHDTLIATHSTTPAVLGVTVGTSTPGVTAIYTLPSSFTIEAGYDYIFQFHNLDSGGTVVNCGFQYFSAAAGTQRRAGFQAATATPTTFTNLTTTRSPAIALYKPVQKTRLPATDAISRNLLNQKDAETLAAMNQRNVTNLYVNAVLFPNTLAVPASFWGDSLTQDSIGSPALPGVGFRATDVADTVTSGTVNNYGINGETSSQITARVSAASAGDKAGFNQVLMGANDTGAVKTAALILADYATCAAAFTNANYLMVSSWDGGAFSGKLRDVWTGLRSTYGAKALDTASFWARYAAQASDVSTARRGRVPPDMTSDTTHQNQAGGLAKGYLWAAALVARNGGAPFVHDDMFGFKSGDASGAAIATVRTLGTAYNHSIIAGNEDGAVQIARGTGAITRTAKTILQPYREVFVEAENNKGKGRNGRIILVQQMDGTSPQKAVRVVGNGASLQTMPTTYTPADGPEMTIVVCARLDPTKSTGYLISQNGVGGILIQQGNQMTFTARDAAAASRGSMGVTAQSPHDFHFYFFSIKTDTELMKVSCDETSSSGTSTAGNIALSTINTLFSNGSDSLPWSGDVKMLAIYGTYYDVSDTAVRANWYDSATRLPKDIGDGTAGGALAAPLIYRRGMAGDYILGKNFGTGGDLNVPIPVGREHLGFTDVEL